jgi:hypothetical protein
MVYVSSIITWAKLSSIEGNQSCQNGPIFWGIFLTPRVPRYRQAVKPFEINAFFDSNPTPKPPISPRTAAGRAAAKARGRTGGRPRTDPEKLEHARIL